MIGSHQIGCQCDRRVTCLQKIVGTLRLGLFGIPEITDYSREPLDNFAVYILM